MPFFKRVGQRLSAAGRALLGRAPARPPRDRGPRWPNFRSSGLTVDKISAYTRNADQGYTWELFELLQEIQGRDPLVKGQLTTLLSSVSQRPVKVKPKNPDAQGGEEHAKWGQGIVDGLRLVRPEGEHTRADKSLAGVVEALAMASWYGVRAGWIHWKGNRPVGIEPFDERRLFVDIQDESLHLNSDGSTGRGVPLSAFDPANIFEVRATRISPRLSLAGDGRAILFDWWLRFEGLKNFSNYIETWSRPGLVGIADKDVAASYGGDDQLENFRNFLEDYLGDTRALLPPGFEVEVLNAVAGGHDVFESLDLLTEKHIMYAITGETGTATGGDQGGGRAGKEVNERVRADRTQGLSQLVGEALERILRLASAAEYGLGMPDLAVEFETELTPDALGAKGRAISSVLYAVLAAVKSGYPIDVPELLKEYGVPFREDGTIPANVLKNLEAMARAQLGGAPAPDGNGNTPGGPPVGAPPPDPDAVANPEFTALTEGERAAVALVLEAIRPPKGAPHD